MVFSTIIESIDMQKTWKNYEVNTPVSTAIM
jgi:hypothetical protein